MTEQYLGGVHAVKTMFEDILDISRVLVAKGKHTDWFVEMAKQHGIELQYDKPTLDQWLPGNQSSGSGSACRQLPSLGLSVVGSNVSNRKGTIASGFRLYSGSQNLGALRDQQRLLVLMVLLFQKIGQWVLPQQSLRLPQVALPWCLLCDG